MPLRVITFKADERFLEEVEKARLKIGFSERSEFIRFALEVVSKCIRENNDVSREIMRRIRAMN